MASAAKETSSYAAHRPKLVLQLYNDNCKIDGCKDVGMTDSNMENERQARAAEIQRTIAERNPVAIHQGIDSFKRDLPKLLAQNKRDHVVAYHGDKQVALEPTREQVNQILHDRGIVKRGEMFVTSISSIETDDFPSRNR